MKKEKKILVITADAILQSRLTRSLECRGFIVSNARSYEDELWEAIEDVAPDLIIVDPVVPGLQGVVSSVNIRRWCQAPILILSAADAGDNKVRQLDLHSPDLLTKPFDIDELISKLGLILS